MRCLRLHFLGVFIVSSTASLIGCSVPPPVSPRDAADANDTGRRVAPNGEGERALLSQVSAFPSGALRQLGATSVVAEDPYQAASGRVCRALRLTREKSQQIVRLACNDGKSWFFVPDVFAGAPTPDR